MRREETTIQQSPLPSGYQQLEYIESTGTQYIYLPSFAVNESDTITVDWMALQAPGPMTHPLVCSRGRDKRYYIAGYFNNSPKNFWIYMQQSNVNVSPNYGHSYGERFTITCTRTSFTDGVNSVSFTGSYNQCYTGTLFGAHYNEWTYQYTIGKYRFYHITLDTYNGTPRLDFIPALRIADSKPGLYDLVNNQFYINSGTGEFLYN